MSMLINYSGRVLPDKILVEKIELGEHGILKKTVFKIDRKKVIPEDLQDPGKLFNQINELWQKK